MKKTLRTQVFVPALSVLSLALATAVQAQTVELEPLVVTATRFSEDPNQLPIGVSSLDEEAIRTSGASTVSDALIRLLGISGRLDLSGGANHTLDLRGFGETANSNQVVVVDGQRLNEADSSGPQLASIPIESIKRIEVLRGSGAVLYGEGATGGVIVITTKAGLGVARSNTASVYSGLGSNNLRELRANATVASGGFSVDVSGQRRETDNHRQNFRSESDAGSVTAQWSNELFRVGVQHSQNTLSSRLPGPISVAAFKADPTQIRSENSNDWGRINNQIDGLFAEVFFGDWVVMTETGWRKKQHQSLSRFGRYDYDVDAKNAGLRAKNESQWGYIKNQLVIGHDSNTWNRQVYGTYGSISEQKSKAWYVQDDVTLVSGTRISGGIRTEDIVKDGSRQLEDRQNAWNMGISHPVSAASRIWARVGESFRLANMDELNPAVDIRPQTSKDTEAGWSWKQKVFQMDARVYRSSMTDEIGYDPVTSKNINFDPTKRQGLEIDSRLIVMPKLTLSGNLALRRSTFKSGNYAGNDIPLVARETLAVRTHWSVAEGHQLTGGVNWVGARYADFDNQCRMPDYTTVDLRYARKFSYAEFSLSVNNLLDHQFYTNATCSTAKVLSVYPETGRTFLAAVRVNF